MTMTNDISELVNNISLSPNHSGKRIFDVTRITPHVVVGEFDALTVAKWFNDKARQASANYIIGKNGEVVLNVKETNRAWTSGSYDNDQRAITIECSSNAKNHNLLNDKVFEKLIDLCVDICKRYGKTKAVYFANKKDALSYQLKPDEMLFTKHNFFQNVLCPDKWLEDNYSMFIQRINDKLSGTIVNKDDNKLYRVQVGAFRNHDNAIALCNKLKNDGYVDAFIKEV